MEALEYDINTIKTAMNNLSEAQKLGEGQVGAIYKVKLEGRYG